MYKRSRLILLSFVILSAGLLILTDLSEHRFPIGVGTILFITPCLLREWDLKKGRPARSLSSFERSMLLGGALWVGGCLVAYQSL